MIVFFCFVSFFFYSCAHSLTARKTADTKPQQSRKYNASMNASIFAELNELNERFKLPRWTDRERRVFKVVSIPQLSVDQETVTKEARNFTEPVNALSIERADQSGSSRKEPETIAIDVQSENGDLDGSGREGGDREGGDREGGDPEEDGDDQNRQLSAPQNHAPFSARFKQVLNFIREKNPRFMTAFFFITDDPRSAPVLQAPKFRTRKVKKNQREKAQAEVLKRINEVLKRINEGAAQHKNFTDEQIKEKWDAFAKRCPYELRDLDDRHFFGTEKQQINQQLKTIQVLRAQNRCVDVMCEDAATCLFCPAGHGYCDDCGEGFLQALKTGVAEDRCNHVDPVTQKRCCEYLTKDEVDKSGRRVSGTSSYGAVARVEYLQDQRANERQNKRYDFFCYIHPDT